MRKGLRDRKGRCTRCVAIILVVLLVRTSAVLAVEPVPGSLAVLEPPMSEPGMRAAWDGVRSEIYLDPLLLTLGREQVEEALERWHFAADSIRSARLAADRAALERTRGLIDRAWTLYFQFDYEGAVRALKEADGLLSVPGDSGFRTRLMFEVLLLSGMTSRAAGKPSYREDFSLAAALDPQRELNPEKYSPDTISQYDRIRKALLREEPVSVSARGTPPDAIVTIDGIEQPLSGNQARHPVYPGRHFLEVRADGYETWGLTIEARQFEPLDFQFELSPIGPEKDPDGFFLGRLKAGDRGYLALLARKLQVDYLLLPDPGDKVLGVWLIDSDGRTVDHATVWETGEALEAGAFRMSQLIQPLRQGWDPGRNTLGAPFSLPRLSPEPEPAIHGNKPAAAWKSWAVAAGVILLIAVASPSGGGGTKVEATW